VLGKIYLKKLKKPLQAPLWFSKVLPKPYDELPRKPYAYTACLCIELCQIIVTLERILFMLSWSRFTCTPYTPSYAEMRVSIVPSSTPQIKLHLCRDSSLQKYPYKRDMGLSKKHIWTHEGPSIKKKGWTHEGKKEKKKGKKKIEKIAMFSKGFTKGERSYKRSFHPPFTIRYIYTHAHLDMIVWLVFPPWIRFLTLQYMWCKYALSIIPTLSSTYNHR
jgi:hypothetical protein